VSIGLLGLVMTPAQAAAILVVPSLVTNVWQAVVGGGLFALARRLWPMLTGICIGTVVGVMLLPHDESGRATVWLGLALAGQDQRRNVPGVVFRRPAAAWRPSGAARALVID